MADIRPQLPPHLLKNKNEATDIGPQLPPYLLKNENENKDNEPQLPGPQLLTDLAKTESEKSEEDNSDKDQYYGPSLPQSLKKENKSRIIGPALPANTFQGQISSNEFSTKEECTFCSSVKNSFSNIDFQRNFFFKKYDGHNAQS